jgi:hypothetical protein
MHGTSDAKQMVLSFWIKWDNSIGGNFAVDILNLNNSNNRTVSKLFSYTADSGWQKYVWNIPADTGGNALTNDNTSAYYLQIFLSAGSNVTSGTMNTTWATRVNANRAAGQTIQSASSTSNNVYITGIQLEVSDSGASEFEFLPQDVQLQRCQRYYQKLSGAYAQNMFITNGFYNGAGQFQGSYNYMCNMRTAPSLLHTSGTSYYAVARVLSSDYIDEINGLKLYSPNDQAGLIYWDGASGTAGGGGVLYINSSSVTEAALSAEL